MAAANQRSGLSMGAGRSGLEILSIGHSYAVAMNRATMRAIAEDLDFKITVAAPASHAGDLRAIVCEPEPPGSNLKLVKLPARWTSRNHVFHYKQKDLTELSASANFDVVHMWEEPYLAAGYQIARAWAASAARFCFVTCQNLRKSYPPPFSWFERSVIQKSDGWIAIGQTVFSNCIERGYEEHMGKVLPLAVETRAFRPKPELERAALRRRLNLTEPVVGFAGRLVPAKGLRVLMRAMELLPRSISWSLLLLGAGEMEPEIRDWASSRGWADRVHMMLVKHDEVAEYLPVMDFMVAPSQTTPAWREQFGRMLIEAFACGVPVIASDSGEIPYLVAGAGSIVAERDVVGLSIEIGRYLRDPEHRSRMAALGRNRAAQFSVDESARMYEEYFLSLAGSPSGSALTGITAGF
jgi:glycosyltransferase involved in cell wall biosynthesis